MFHSQSGRPRDEVARSFLPKISAATGGEVRGIRSEIQILLRLFGYMATSCQTKIRVV